MSFPRLFVLCLVLCIALVGAQLSSDYATLSPSDKRDQLWSQITQDQTSASWPSIFSQGKLFFEDMSVSGNTYSDIMPSGRQKLIHSVGACAKAKFVWDNSVISSKGYTGFFKKADYAIVRPSCATEPGETGIFSKHKKMIPGMSIKVLRDRSDSCNMVAMWDLDGQEDSYNFFKHSFCTHVSNRASLPLPLRILGKKFSEADANPTSVGISDCAAYTETGIAEASVKFPFALLFVPRSDVTSKWENVDVNFVQHFKDLFTGNEVLYDIYDVPTPGATSFTKLGSLQLQTPFVASKFGDETYFIRHTFWAKDTAYVPSWSNIDPDKDGAYYYEQFL